MKNNTNPLVSLILLSYNHEQFIESAIKGVLSQDYTNMEIIISDDCSTDGSFRIIERMVENYHGRHKVLVKQNHKNLGLVAHFNKLLSMVGGEIIVVAAGDDISIPNRVSKSVDLFIKNENISFLSFVDDVINEDGDIIKCRNLDEDKVISLKDYLDCNGSQPFSGASRAFKRNIYDFFGDLSKNCPTEDTPYLLRGLLLGDGYICSEPGIFYRRHKDNLSGPKYLPYMDVSAIHEQYTQDAKLAHKHGYITNDLKRKHQLWSDKRKRKRLLLSAFQISTTKVKYYFSKIVFSSELTFREKISLLRRVIRERN